MTLPPPLVSRDHGVGGGRRGAFAPPKYFKNYKELVRKSVLCPHPNIESLMVPPPISKLLRGPWLVLLNESTGSKGNVFIYNCEANRAFPFEITSYCYYIHILLLQTRYHKLYSVLCRDINPLLLRLFRTFEYLYFRFTERLSPILCLGVNLFPSRFVYRTALMGGTQFKDPIKNRARYSVLFYVTFPHDLALIRFIRRT